MSLFRLLRWSSDHRKALRILDYVIGLLTLGYGLWQNHTVSIVLGVVFLLAAIFNLSERMKFFLPRIEGKKNKTDV
jgi:hypothetical protein